MTNSFYRPPLMLVRGRCSQGHPIKSLDDTRLKRDRGRDVYRCRECSRLDGEQYRRRKGEKPGRQLLSHRGPRYVEFDCGHKLIFNPPWPSIDDIVLCMHCGTYRPVSAYGPYFEEKR